MLKCKFQIQWRFFILLYSLVITALNFKFFSYSISCIDMQNEVYMAYFMPVAGFAIINLIFSILFSINFIIKPLSIILLLISSICAYFMIFLGTIFDKSIIKSMLDTTIQESEELINLNIILWFLLTGILPSILILYTKIENIGFKKELKRKISYMLLSLFFVLALGAGLSKGYFSFFRMNKDARYYPNPFYPISSFVKFTKKRYFAKKIPFREIGLDAKINDNKKRILLLVVGETARSANFSANGYTKNNTNFYTKNEFVSFKNVTSCDTFTAHSVPCMFSNLTRKKFSLEKAEHQSNLLDILQTANVDVSWYDNDTGCKGVCKRVKDSIINKKRDTDEWILQKTKQRLKNIDSNNTIIVLHLIGSHGPTYFKRYPKEFEKFKPVCNTSKLETCSDEEVVNTYDNTILYTDFILHNLKQELDKFKNDYKIGLIYISDHGESLGEDDIYLHGIPYSIAPDYQTHVPMMFYFDDNKTMQNLKKIENEKFSHDNLFHSVLGFFDVNTTLYKPDLDIFAKINKSEEK